jgi:hypothetical protein
MNVEQVSVRELDQVFHTGFPQTGLIRLSGRVNFPLRTVIGSQPFPLQDILH